MLSWIRKHQQSLIFSSLLIYLFIALFDRGGIHYPAVLLLSVAMLPFSMMMFAKGKQRSSGLPPWLLATTWLFLATFILSYLFAEVRNFGLTSLVVYTTGPLLLVLLSSISIQPQLESRFLRALVLLGGLAALVGMAVFFTEPFNRLAAPFRNSAEVFSFFPNAMADFLLLLIPVGAWASWFTKRKQRIVYMSLNILMLTAFFLTFSRGAYIALAGGWVVFALFQVIRFRSQSTRSVIASALIIAIAFGISWGVGEYRAQLFADSTINATSASDKIALEANEGNSSVSERVDFWKGSLLLIPMRPWFGAGAESFRYLYPQVQVEMLATSDHPHNVLLKMALDHGLLATGVLIALLLGYLFVFSQRSRTWDDEEYTRLTLLLAGCLALFAHNLIDYNLQFTTVSVLFWILLGVISSHWRSSGKQSTLLAVPVFVLSIALFGLGIWEGAHTIAFRKGTAAFEAEQYAVALEHFDNAEGVLFPRNLYIDQAIASNELFQETKDEQWMLQSQQSLEKHLELNPHDAFAWYLFAESSPEDSGNASHYLRNALNLDPLNNLEYYESLFDTWNDSPFVIPPQYQVEYIDQLLDTYLQKLTVNAHHTILTKNPEAAVALCEDVENYFQQEDARCDALADTYAEEVRKFEEAYGSIEDIY